MINLITKNQALKYPLVYFYFTKKPYKFTPQKTNNSNKSTKTAR